MMRDLLSPSPLQTQGHRATPLPLKGRGGGYAPHSSPDPRNPAQPCDTLLSKVTQPDHRSARREVRNPVLALPGVKLLLALDPATRAAIATALRSIQADARQRAEKSWKTHKAPMALYWKAVGVYAGHLARALS